MYVGTPTIDPWLEVPAPLPDAALRLFCLPYAGAGPVVFRRWATEPDAGLSGVELAAVRLPGRAPRLDEPALRDMDTLVSALAHSVRRQLDRPYAMLGHSLGGRVAFELIRQLRRDGARPPVALVVSGSRPPRRQRARQLHELPDAELVDWLRSLGGTDPRLLANLEVVRMLLPSLRADLQVEASHVYRAEPALRCPILAFAGTDDPEAPADQMADWQAETDGLFHLRVLPGNHFFLQAERHTILGALATQLRP